MRKIALFLIGLCLFSSCKNKKEDNTIKYVGPKTIDIVLQEKYKIEAKSKGDISFYSENEIIAEISPDGTITGKNIGTTNIKLSTTEDELSIPVVVNLFEEPTLNFGASLKEIKDLYGTPQYSGDNVIRYGGGEVHPDEWYSFTVWMMDFFFIDDEYVEADVYIDNDWKGRLNEYLNKYSYKGLFNDTLNGELTDYHLYLNNEDPEKADVMIGKIDNVGKYNDICLFYIPYESKTRAKVTIPESVKNKVLIERQ